MLAKTVIITGGSRGLGWELSQKYLNANYEVIVLARSKPEKLSEFKNLHFYPLDLIDSSSISKAIQKVAKDFKHIDLLVHNAGIMMLDEGVKATAESLNKVMRINFQGPVEITKTIFDKFSVDEKGIKVIYVSSSGAIVPRAGFSHYSASKAASEGYFNSLKNHYSYTDKIDFSVVRPAFINSKYDVVVNASDTFAFELEKMKALRALSPTAPEDVVNKIWNASQKRKMKTVYNVGFEGMMVDLSHRILPPKVFKTIQDQALHFSHIIHNKMGCTKFIRSFYPRNGLAFFGGLAAATAIITEFASGGDLTGSANFFYEFIGSMKKRADEVTKDPAKIVSKIEEHKLLEPYVAPPKAPSCDGVYYGELLMEGSLAEFLELWNHQITTGFGSINDRMYADLVGQFYRLSRENFVLSNLKVSSLDTYFTGFEDGTMTWMTEDVVVKQFGMPVSHTIWQYNRTQVPQGRNSFEDSLAKFNCDLNQVNNYYQSKFDPKGANPETKLKMTFTVKKLDPAKKKKPLGFPKLPLKNQEFYHSFKMF